MVGFESWQTGLAIAENVMHRTATGRRVLAIATRRAADDHRKIVEADLMRGMWIDPRAAATTFDDWAKRWLAQNPAKRPSALARDETIVRVHLKPALEILAAVAAPMHRPVRHACAIADGHGGIPRGRSYG